MASRNNDVGDRRPELPDDPDVLVVSHSRPLHFQPWAIALVFTGGALGTLARYGVEESLPHVSPGWPWATFAINLLGAFVLGAVLEGLARMGADTGWRQRARLLVGTGLCGAFTTYSTLALEADTLGRDGHIAIGVIYALTSVLAGVIAAWAGITIASSVHRWRRTEWQS